ncbi:MAG: CBS domain-containing protein [Caldilineaceae bacterium]
MHRMLVNQIMQRSVITIHPTALAADAAQIMEEFGIRRLPVIDENDCLVGIVTDTDVLEAETADRVLNSYEPGAEEEWLSVSDVMTHEVITIDPQATVGELAQQFIQHKIGGIPVMEVAPNHCNQRRLIGIVTETDIFRMIADAWQAEQAKGRG